jgi:hypothetical protein
MNIDQTLKERGARYGDYYNKLPNKSRFEDIPQTQRCLPRVWAAADNLPLVYLPRLVLSRNPTSLSRGLTLSNQPV